MTCTASRHGGGPGLTWLSAYTGYGCRCPEARKAATRAQTRIRMQQLRGQERLVPASGAVLRLRALQAVGWPITTLAKRLGYSSKCSLGPLLYGEDRKSITVARHQKIVALYNELWDQTGPSVRSVRRAQRMRWPLPMDLDDDLLDNPDYRPDDNRLDEVTARRQEREVLLDRLAELDRKGLSAAQISAELGISSRAVVRRRAAARLAQAA